MLISAHEPDSTLTDSRAGSSTNKWSLGVDVGTLLDFLPTAAYTCDPEGLILSYNPEAERIWGRVPKLMDPEDRFCGSLALLEADGTPVSHDECWMAQALHQQKGFNGHEAVIRRPDGQDVHVLAHANPIHDASGRLIGAINVLVDLSERKVAERTIQQISEAVAPRIGEHFFRALANCLSQTSGVDYAFIGAFDDSNFKRVHSIAFSRRGKPFGNFSCNLLGTPCAEAVDQSFCFYPRGVRAKFPKALPLQELNIESYMGMPLFSSQGRLLGLIALLGVQEIKNPEKVEAILRVVAVRAAAELERKSAEQDLRDSEARYAGLVNNLEGIVWEADATTLQYRFVSQQAERILGYAPQCWLEEPDFWASHVHRDDRERVVAKRLDCIARAVDHKLEYRLIDSEDRVIWVQDLVSVETFENRAITLRGVTVDISDRKQAEQERQRMESQMRHAQKLESMGVLAGGIAHDFNNLLTSILGNASLALLQLPPDSPIQKQLREIEKAAERSAALTGQMLAYSGQSEMTSEPLHLDTLVQEMCGLLSTAVSKNTYLDLDLQPATVEGDPMQIQQVVMNLITNASEALEGHTGTVSVKTRIGIENAQSLSSPFFPVDLPEGPYACFEVKDSGCGMNDHTLARIFDPFFTTKFTGRGLGLAATLGIVRSHRGTITVKSSPGSGTLFRVLLPCYSKEVEQLKSEASTGLLPLPTHRGKILVVEDEPAVSELVRCTLESVGFEALVARDGLAGLRLLEAHRDEISVVLVDLTMPQLDGLQTLDKLRQRAPNLPVVLMNGYSEQAVDKACAGLGPDELLQKPFRPIDLVERIQRITQRSSSEKSNPAGSTLSSPG